MCLHPVDAQNVLTRNVDLCKNLKTNKQIVREINKIDTIHYPTVFELLRNVNYLIYLHLQWSSHEIFVAICI